VARDFNGSTDQIDYDNVVNLAGSAVTISAWVYLDDLDADQTIFNAGISSDGEGLDMGCWGSSQSGELYIYRDAGPWHQRYGTDNFDGSAWEHALAVDDSGHDTTGMECYIDGVVPGSETNSGSGSESALTGLWTIGALGTGSSPFNGRICEVGVWDRIVSADERSALAKGFSPLFFRRGLLFYTKMIGRKDIDIIAGKTPTYDGTVVVAHPRIIYPG